MKRSKVAILVYIVVAFAVFGLLTQLFSNTVNFLIGILVTLAIAAAIFALFYFVLLRNRNTSDETKKYKQAVKQSKMKYQQNTAPKKVEPSKLKKNTAIRRRGKRRASHLRVIEGN